MTIASEKAKKLFDEDLQRNGSNAAAATKTPATACQCFESVEELAVPTGDTAMRTRAADVTDVADCARDSRLRAQFYDTR